MAEKRKWSLGWAAFVASTTVAFIGFMIYAYMKGKSGNAHYMPTYNFFHNPSWQHFKEWWAQMANDPLTEMLLMFVVMILPVPFLPYYIHERMELLLAKLGLYQMITVAILGSPNYDPDAGAFGGEQEWQYILGWVFLAAVIGVSIYSILCSKGKIHKSLCLEK